MGKPRDKGCPATSLKDHVVLITGASRGKSRALIASIAQHPGWARSVDHARNPLAAT